MALTFVWFVCSKNARFPAPDAAYGIQRKGALLATQTTARNLPRGSMKTRLTLCQKKCLQKCSHRNLRSNTWSKQKINFNFFHVVPKRLFFCHLPKVIINLYTIPKAFFFDEVQGSASKSKVAGRLDR